MTAPDLAPLPPCGCPGAAPLYGVQAYAVHPHGMTCHGCGRQNVRALWWISGEHLCSPCFRLLSDVADGYVR